ncbi:MAG: hypothetical protein ACRDIA_08225, partial [Actinomycetota bacterium]
MFLNGGPKRNAFARPNARDVKRPWAGRRFAAGAGILALIASLSGSPAAVSAPSAEAPSSTNQADDFAKQSKVQLETARGLVAEMDKDQPDKVAAGFSVAQLAVAGQAKRIGVELKSVEPSSRPSAPPSQAALELLKALDVIATEAQTVQIKSFDELPDPLGDALSGYLRTFTDYHQASKQAFAQLDPKDVEQAQNLAGTAISQAGAGQAAGLQEGQDLLRKLGIDLKPLLDSQIDLLDAAEQLTRATNQNRASAVKAPAPDP